MKVKLPQAILDQMRKAGQGSDDDSRPREVRPQGLADSVDQCPEGEAVRSYIYGLYDSRTPAEIAYVGRTKRLAIRFECHVSGRDSNTGEWVRAVRKGGGSIRFMIFESCNTLHASERESWWICQTWPSLNFNGKVVEQFGPGEFEESGRGLLYWPERRKYFRGWSSAAKFFATTVATVKLHVFRGEAFYGLNGQAVRLIEQKPGARKSISSKRAGE